jgi:hypothetical protein
MSKNPHDEIKYSNPSNGAYLKSMSEYYYGADESKNSPSHKLGLEAQTSTTDNHEYLY